MTEREVQESGRRRVAVVLIAAVAVWLGGQAMAPGLGVPVAWMLVLDLAALVAFGWAIWATWRLSRGAGRRE